MRIDWDDQTRVDEIHVLMVDPHNLEHIRGELTNLILSDCSISYSYNADTRVSAKLATLGTNYISGSWLRILHMIGDSYVNELGTFVLDGDPTYTYKNHQRIYSYSLQSVLWALSNDFCTFHYAIGTGVYSLDVFDTICARCNKESIHLPGARNYRYQSSKVYSIGDSYLSFLFDVCDSSNNRLNVDGHGRITIEPYVAPSKITPAWTEDSISKKTLLLSDDISYEVSTDPLPSRAIVVYTNGDNEISAYADLPSSSKYSYANRGYVYSKIYQINDIENPTMTQLQTLAKSYLNESQAVNELKPSFLYFPCKCGETMYLNIDGERKKYLIYSYDLSLDTMHISSTLKEV